MKMVHEWWKKWCMCVQNVVTGERLKAGYSSSCGCGHCGGSEASGSSNCCGGFSGSDSPCGYGVPGGCHSGEMRCVEVSRKVYKE